MSKKTKVDVATGRKLPVRAVKAVAAPDTHARTLAISRAIADPRRYEVLRRIAAGSKSSCADLRECTGMNAGTLSHHVKQLEAVGLIETRRDGRLLRAELKKKVWKGYLGDLKAIGS